jgi:hypothetical protein
MIVPNFAICALIALVKKHYNSMLWLVFRFGILEGTATIPSYQAGVHHNTRPIGLFTASRVFLMAFKHSETWVLRSSKHCAILEAEILMSKSIDRRD